MAIAPSTWAFREGLPSSKHSRQTLEQTWPGRLIMHTNAATQLIVGPATCYIGWYRFNPAKQIHNRMRIQGAVNFGTVEYSLDGGTTWAAVVLSTVSTPATTIVSLGDSGAFSNAQLGLADVDLSGIVSTQWIGVRVSWNTGQLEYNLAALLYNDTYNPF